MSDSADGTEYYRRRIQQERHLAQRSTDGQASLIHARLADEYERKVAAALHDGGRSTLD